MVPVIAVDLVPEEEGYLTVGIDTMNIALHAALVTVVKYDYLLCRSGGKLPGAPEQAAAGKTQQVQNLVDQVAEAGLGNAEGCKYAAG